MTPDTISTYAEAFQRPGERLYRRSAAGNRDSDRSRHEVQIL